MENVMVLRFRCDCCVHCKQHKCCIHPHTINHEELMNKMEEKCSWNLAKSTHITVRALYRIRNWNFQAEREREREKTHEEITLKYSMNANKRSLLFVQLLSAMCVFFCSEKQERKTRHVLFVCHASWKERC